MNHANSSSMRTDMVAPISRSLGRALDWALACVLCLLPFELATGVALPGLVVTNVELVISATLALWLLMLASERRPPAVPRRLWLPVLLVLVVLTLSALLAHDFRGAALKFTLRQIQGALIGLCAAERMLVGGTPLARRLVTALLIGGGISALLGLIEISESPVIINLLQIFKEKPTLMGGLLRLSATFGYANIAGMYFEALLPFALVCAALVLSRSWRARPFMSFLAIVLPIILFIATLLTFSRASLVTVLALVALLPTSVWLLVWTRQILPAFAWRLTALCVGLLAICGLLIISSPVMRLRLTAADASRWYHATYTTQTIPTLLPNEVYTSTIQLMNDGQASWRAAGLRPFALSYHLLDASTRRVVRYDGLRTPLPHDVAPGESLQLAARLQAPPSAGSYLLVWDLVQESATWLSEGGTTVAEVAVEVVGSAPQAAAPRQIAPPQPAESPSIPSEIRVEAPPPDRGPLWRAAFALWRGSPLLGIGPDVFRHVYGPLLGLMSFDDRIHTNNLYIEILVGSGMLGLIATGLLLASVIVPAIQTLRLRRIEGIRLILLLGSFGGLTAFLIHGLLDMFLEYTATYVLLWVLVGFLSALTSDEQTICE